ncbi:protein-tyrosine phosphatase-like protein [Protomyces lactucae-debilis]|uniref:Protein-tyrosine phosphatase-like protein n=1 Tax=Protomyces lactucae-debilis TaxID=2754530 RepID=A0A1Y2EXK9_PROLT|nr:protein-tyrosine phosphatase-like protein [Protomyces lactucae-debilis]ORY76310.1 protein-tyrosine phosphatase-like protein [Protomyces lactucae-debilis]
MKDNGKTKTAWPQIHQVTDNLFISDIYAAQSAKKLDEYDITHIISLLSYSSILVPPHVKHLKLDVLDYDDENILQEFESSRQWIDEAIKGGGRVLIHCQAGISRSSTILCAYIMASQNIPRDEAFEMIKRVRSHVKPNPGFWEQLLVWEQYVEEGLLQNRRQG